MTCRTLLQTLKSKLEVDSALENSEIDFAMIGTSKSARANIMFQVEGKLHVLEVCCRDLGIIEEPTISLGN